MGLSRNIFFSCICYFMLLPTSVNHNRSHNQTRIASRTESYRGALWAYSGVWGSSNFLLYIFRFRPKMSGLFIFFYFSAEKGKSFYGRPLFKCDTAPGSVYNDHPRTSRLGNHRSKNCAVASPKHANNSECMQGCEGQTSPMRRLTFAAFLPRPSLVVKRKAAAFLFTTSAGLQFFRWANRPPCREYWDRLPAAKLFPRI